MNTHHRRTHTGTEHKLGPKARHEWAGRRRADDLPWPQSSEGRARRFSPNSTGARGRLLAQRSVTTPVERSVESSTNPRRLSSGGWFQALLSTPSILPNAWCGCAPARALTPVREHTHTTTYARSQLQTYQVLARHAELCVAAFVSECRKCCGMRKPKCPPSRRSRSRGREASEPRRPARMISRTQRLAVTM